ncbi:MAG: ATP-binding protein, partial [Bacteroidales bacterium]|nr:ATP-binding protein [Bacteroidales bacterium]
DAESTVREYAVWGGVPRYWELRETSASLEDALWEHVFSSNGALCEEPAKLFRDDIRDIVKTSTIMSYIGMGANRLSKIASLCGEPATNLSRPLRKLVDLGYLEREVPFGVSEKDTKKSLYKIADPFIAFYYRFVVPNRSFIEMDRRAIVQNELAEHFHEFASMQWERICRDAVSGNVIRGTLYGKASRWWGSVLNENGRPEQIEIDLVAESYDKRKLLVGECKWTGGEYGNLLTSELERKAGLLPFARGHEIVPVLFMRTAPLEDIGNALLPDDVIGLSAN